LDKIIQEKRLDITFVPGYAGSSNPATLQILKDTKRHPENPIYRFGNVDKDDAGPLVDFYEENNLGTETNSICGKIEKYQR